MIVSNVIRGDIDINRPSSLGTENNFAEKIWKTYFDSVEDACKKIKK